MRRSCRSLNLFDEFSFLKSDNESITFCCRQEFRIDYNRLQKVTEEKKLSTISGIVCLQPKEPYCIPIRILRHREQVICKFGSQFYHQTLIVEQCALQIYIKQAMTTLKIYMKLCGSLINSICLVFLCFGKPRWTK